MSKKRDPLVAVIHYFNTVDLTAAEQARVMVTEIVRSRQPPKKAAPVKRKAETATRSGVADSLDRIS